MKREIEREKKLQRKNDKAGATSGTWWQVTKTKFFFVLPILLKFSMYYYYCYSLSLSITEFFSKFSSLFFQSSNVALKFLRKRKKERELASFATFEFHFIKESYGYISLEFLMQEKQRERERERGERDTKSWRERFL